MPAVTVLFYREGNEVPVLDWLDEQSEAAQAQVTDRIERLEDQGHSLRRPHAENIGQGLYELRARVGREQYRILYFFYGRTAVVLAHGLTKEDVLPPADIQRALTRKERFERDPANHYLGR
jgi:phage-related protein